MYKILNSEQEDKSTNNLSRKYNKLIRSYEKNPTNNKIQRIEHIKSVLYPEKRVDKPKCYTIKKIDNAIFRLIKNDKNMQKQLDSRIFTSYILLLNILPDELIQIIIKMCNFNFRGYVLNIPKSIYVFARPMIKNKEEKNKIINYYKKNKQMMNLINNIHSMKTN